MHKIKYSKELNAIVDGVIVNPEKVVATFSDEYHERAKRQLIINHDCGLEMLYAYEEHRDNMHILNVCDMLKKLEEIYSKYSYQTYENRQKNSVFDEQESDNSHLIYQCNGFTDEKCRCGCT